MRAHARRGALVSRPRPHHCSPCILPPPCAVFASCQVSARTGAGVSDAVAAIRQERRGRDVYVIGAANVGKSAFIRALVK